MRNPLTLHARVVVRALLLTAAYSGMITLAGCKDLVGSQPVSAGTPNPRVYETPDGALLKVYGVRGLLGEASNYVLLNSGLLTDELFASDGSSIDARRLPESENSEGAAMYGALQNLRVQAALAVIAMRRAFPDSLRAVRGEMFAVQGYSELLLADVFCSGIPLSMPREGADIDYRSGSPRDSVYAHALTLFDSAVTLSADSQRIVTLARIGKGRALLNLARYDSAASAVHDVQTADRYQLLAIVGIGKPNGIVENTDFGNSNVSDREGEVGLPYRSSNDPRTPYLSVNTPVVVDGIAYTVTRYAPAKYPQADRDSVLYTVADGIEARLIEAEAELKAGETRWLETLNALRTSGQFDTMPVFQYDTTKDVNGNPVLDPSGNPTHVDTTYLRNDTLWTAGSGGIAELPPLADPGTATTRVAALFAERAAWLYLTGHRQGDLRREIRQYQINMFPRGAYLTSGKYGSDVTFPIPTTETINPFFHGCLDRAP